MFVFESVQKVDYYLFQHCCCTVCKEFKCLWVYKWFKCSNYYIQFYDIIVNCKEDLLFLRIKDNAKTNEFKYIIVNSQLRKLFEDVMLA